MFGVLLLYDCLACVVLVSCLAVVLCVLWVLWLVFAGFGFVFGVFLFYLCDFGFGVFWCCALLF